jgi:hypothetical protein
VSRETGCRSAELLDVLRLDGCIVTLDAMGCQKEIAERIRAKGADYLLVLKANHGRAFEAVREHFERTCFGRGSGGRPGFTHEIAMVDQLVYEINN